MTTNRNRGWTYNIECEDDISTPDDMCGPIVGYVLRGTTSVGTARGRGSFSNLSEAIEVARNVEDCVGVTKGKGGYQLRLNHKFYELSNRDDLKDHVKTWVFRDHVKTWVLREKSVDELNEMKTLKRIELLNKKTALVKQLRAKKKELKAAIRELDNELDVM